MTKVNKICILGGGTSGFSIASMLSRYNELSNGGLDITVVFSSNIGNIGVGESTLLSINDLFYFLGLNDSDWMKQSNATYKTSISFENFYKQGTKFQYPFGRPNTDDIYAQKWFELKDHFPETFTHDTFARYLLPHTRLNEKNKLSFDMPGYDFASSSAYHFDTHLLAKVLKKYASDRGVTFIDDTYQKSIQDSKGNITSIVCDNTVVDADLFIDCSGFKSLLLEKVMGVDYIDFNNTLINNRVVRIKIPYTDKNKQLKNYTNCVALKNGWCWEIPLWDSLSLGYVHSLKFASEEDILEEFKMHCASHGVNINEDDISIINYKTGRHEKGWVKNVISVGLSYGFLEPLESTGILTLLHNSFKALEMLSKRDFNYTNVDRDIFNYTVAKEIDFLRGFVEMHYAFSSRDDSEYWQYVTDDIDYPKTSETEYFRIIKQTVDTRKYVNHGGVGSSFILAGMGYSPYSPAFNKRQETYPELFQRKEDFEKQEKYFDNILNTFPSTAEFLEQNIYR
jgi:tryptophan halogenase